MAEYLNQVTNYLLTQSWQIVILVIVIAAASWLLRNKSAHVRYLLWLIVLAKCLVPPFATIPLAVLPQEKTILLSELETLPPMIAEPVTSAPAPKVSSPTPVAVQPGRRLNMRQWLAIAWIAGASIFVLVALIKAWRTICWLHRERRPLLAELQTTIEGLFHDFGTLPKLWLIEGIGQPFVWGLLRGSIYLPADFVTIVGAERRKSILAHELCHILRFDAAVNLMQVIAQAIFWFHPFVWWANKKIRAEREKCCDEMAIAHLGAKVKDYSSAIVNILVSEYESTRPVPSLAVAGPVKNIEERIKTMLRPGKKFYKRPSLIAATIVSLLALLIVPTALALTTQAAMPEGSRTYYVAQKHPQASDDNTGTEDRPWKTARHGAMQLQPGDTLIIKEGYYYYYTGKRYEPGIRTARSGTAEKPITIKAHPGDNVVAGSVPTPDTPAGNSTNPAIGAGGDHVIIDGFRIYGCATFWGVKDCVLRNCEIWSGNDSEFNDCIRLEHAERILIQNNIVHDNDNRVSMPGSGSNRGNAPLLMEYDSRDCVIEHNQFCNAAGAAILFKDNPRNMTVRYNLFWGNGDGVMGPVQWHGQRIVVHNNVFRGLTGAAICTHATDLKGFLVFNNTFLNNATDISTWTAGHKDIQIFNNIFRHTIAEQLYMDVAPHASDPSRDGALPNITLFDNNCYHGMAGWKVNYRTVAKSLEEWRGYGSYGFDKHSFVADPKFVDMAKGDFRLRVDSPCLGTGKDGQTIGAYVKGTEVIGLDPKINVWANNPVNVDYSAP